MQGVTIISGGQRGVDTAALRVACRLQLPYTGWVPNGYTNESGQIDASYRQSLRETASSDSAERTELNVRAATHVLTLQRGLTYTGGTKLGVDISQQHGKSMMFVDLDKDWLPQVNAVQQWLLHDELIKCAIGGPRESQQPGIEEEATCFLMQTFYMPRI